MIGQHGIGVLYLSNCPECIRSFNTCTYSTPDSGLTYTLLSAVYSKLTISSLASVSLILITGCAVAQHCCKGDQPFQWETPKFDPSYFPNPLIFPDQNLHR